MKIVIALVVFATLGYRLFLGIDFTDESYYLAMALRFAAGDRPFVDELFIHQIPSVLTAPLAWLYERSGAGREGIVLAFRFFFLLLGSFGAFILYQRLKSRLSELAAFGLALVLVICIPLQIPAISYNSLGSLAFSLFLWWSLGIEKDRSRLSLFAWGALGIFTTTMYPPLLPAVFLAMGSQLHRRQWPWVAFGGSTVGFFALALLLQAGEKVGLALGYSLVVFQQGGGWEKWKLVFQHLFLFDTAIGWRLWTLGLLTLGGIRIFRPLLFFVTPLAVAFAYRHALFVSLWWTVYLAALAPVLYWRIAPKERPVGLLYKIWLPSVFGGFCVAWASASNPINASLALIPALGVSLLCVQAALSARLRWALWIQVVLIALGAQFWEKAFYRDGDWSELTAQVTQGPFRYLRTTPQKKRFLEMISRDIKREQTLAHRIFFHEFPAGYLITRQLPATYSSWTRQASRKKDVYVDGLRQFSTPENRVFLLKSLTHEWDAAQRVEYHFNDPLSQYLLATHTIIRNEPEYVILRPRG